MLNKNVKFYGIAYTFTTHEVHVGILLLVFCKFICIKKIEIIYEYIYDIFKINANMINLILRIQPKNKSIAWSFIQSFIYKVFCYQLIFFYDIKF